MRQTWWCEGRVAAAALMPGMAGCAAPGPAAGGDTGALAGGGGPDRFPCEASEPPYGSFGGWHPVYLDDEATDSDPATAGGDGFDWAQQGLTEARDVRITDRPDLVGMDGVFDLAAVGVVHAACR